MLRFTRRALLCATLAAFPGGVIVAHYRRAGAVTTGSFVAESAAVAQP
ncbi:hypothetical protein ACU0IO_000725 [Serratia marcescens]